MYGVRVLRQDNLGWDPVFISRDYEQIESRFAAVAVGSTFPVQLVRYDPDRCLGGLQVLMEHQPPESVHF